jgi:hypothetical protein
MPSCRGTALTTFDRWCAVLSASQSCPTGSRARLGTRPSGSSPAGQICRAAAAQSCLTKAIPYSQMSRALSYIKGSALPVFTMQLPRCPPVTYQSYILLPTLSQPRFTWFFATWSGHHRLPVRSTSTSCIRDHERPTHRHLCDLHGECTVTSPTDCNRCLQLS